MATAEDVARAIQMRDLETAEEMLARIVARILEEERDFQAELRRVWIRYCDLELCIDVILVPAFGDYTSVHISTIERIGKVLEEIGNLIYPGNPYRPLVVAEVRRSVPSIIIYYVIERVY
jgi:hypothetical protein